MVELAEHPLRQQRTGDHRTAALAAGPLQNAAVLVKERAIGVIGGLGDRRELGCDGVRVGKLHARHLGTGLGGEQRPVTGVHVAAESPAQERAATGCQDHRTGPDPERLVALASVSGGTGDRADAVNEKLADRAVVENAYTGPLDPDPHPAHVLRALQPPAYLLAVVVDRERVTADVRQLVHALECPVEDPGHPPPVGEMATESFPAGHGLLALCRVRGYIPDPRAAGGGRAAGAAVALVREDDVGTGAGGRERSPGGRGATTDDEDVGGQVDALGRGHGGTGAVGGVRGHADLLVLVNRLRMAR